MRRLRSFQRRDRHRRLTEDDDGLHSSEPLIMGSHGLLEDRLVRDIEAHVAQQQKFIQVLMEFRAALEAGSDPNALMSSSAFRHLLPRLMATQQQQRELLSSAGSDRIAREFPTLIQQSRTLIDTLDEITNWKTSPPRTGVSEDMSFAVPGTT
mmetsp:Transcript_18143/g.30313  ORF Transcript_18143/g.30313 Transcript_18143/m.30313 type:complete len:153 (-) Transcript_18143:163-621(-)|eukprot:CAMPEP_0119313020 /NCGR_PEP_ID=MMETSP1333-20130426/27585_1 /TAXON_ID=418940 /ORGANISM="Scyphosphaera apsteinii, Strain RCC1455" /LENGTH=152 /DNA_ID=CAMNT_0007317737 /DNA_START=196 /DNA_END=654 /DNA_ORIENTATION=+